VSISDWSRPRVAAVTVADDEVREPLDAPEETVDSVPGPAADVVVKLTADAPEKAADDRLIVGAEPVGAALVGAALVGAALVGAALVGAALGAVEPVGAELVEAELRGAAGVDDEVLDEEAFADEVLDDELFGDTVPMAADNDLVRVAMAVSTFCCALVTAACAACTAPRALWQPATSGAEVVAGSAGASTPEHAAACWVSAADDTCIAVSATRCVVVNVACCFASCARVFRVALLAAALAFAVDDALPPDVVAAVLVLAAVTAAACAVVSAAKVALALATAASAEVSASRSAVRSRTASVSPMPTWSPSATATVRTVPDVPKDRSAWSRGVTVPVAFRVWATVPRAAVAER
jgi:hypothetical protein